MVRSPSRYVTILTSVVAIGTVIVDTSHYFILVAIGTLIVEI